MGFNILPGHVIASFLQLDHSPAIVTSLPARLLGSFEEPVGLFILGTILCTMPFSIAKTADFRLTATALPVLLAIFFMDISWFDPFATSSGRTIYTILRRVFGKLCIPVFLKFIIKQPFDMFKWYMIGSAAFRWHMLRIGN
jgi:hypothetical protein